MSLWDQIIRQMMDKAQNDGAFDESDFHGKRLDLSENPFVPEDKRMAYKIMKDNDVVPEWIGDNREIRDAIDAARKELERSHTRFQDTLRRLANRIDVDAIYARDAAHRNWDMERERFRKEGARINKLIETYNLRVPISQLQRLYFNVERELGRFES
jgi:hypothetical protein